MNSARERNPPPHEVHIIFPRLNARGNLWHAETRQNTQPQPFLSARKTLLYWNVIVPSACDLQYPQELRGA